MYVSIYLLTAMCFCCTSRSSTISNSLTVGLALHEDSSIQKINLWRSHTQWGLKNLERSVIKCGKPFYFGSTIIIILWSSSEGIVIQSLHLSRNIILNCTWTKHVFCNLSPSKKISEFSPKRNQSSLQTYEIHVNFVLDHTEPKRI